MSVEVVSEVELEDEESVVAGAVLVDELDSVSVVVEEVEVVLVVWASGAAAGAFDASHISLHIASNCENKE